MKTPCARPRVRRRTRRRRFGHGPAAPGGPSRSILSPATFSEAPSGAARRTLFKSRRGGRSRRLRRARRLQLHEPFRRRVRVRALGYGFHPAHARRLPAGRPRWRSAIPVLHGLRDLQFRSRPRSSPTSRSAAAPQTSIPGSRGSTPVRHALHRIARRRLKIFLDPHFALRLDGRGYSTYLGRSTVDSGFNRLHAEPLGDQRRRRRRAHHRVLARKPMRDPATIAVGQRFEPNLYGGRQQPLQRAARPLDAHRARPVRTPEGRALQAPAMDRRAGRDRGGAERSARPGSHTRGGERRSATRPLEARRQTPRQPPHERGLPRAEISDEIDHVLTRERGREAGTERLGLRRSFRRGDGISHRRGWRAQGVPDAGNRVSDLGK